MRLWTLLWLAPLLLAQGPEGAVTLRLVNPHPFRVGEVIQAEIRIPEFAIKRGSPPPEEQWVMGGLLLEPAGECGTVAKPCWLREMSRVNGLRGFGQSAPAALNAYLPELRSGHYRVALLARKLVRQAGVYRDPQPPDRIESQWVDLEIVPATAQWVRETIARSVASGDSTQLSYLNDPAAWSGSLDLLPKDESVLLAGLERGRPQARVCELMRARVSAPKQSVSTSYFYAMANVCAGANLPPAPVQHAGPVSAVITVAPYRQTAIAPADPQMAAWAEKRHTYTENMMNEGAAALAGSLAAKQGPAKWSAFETLLERVRQMRVNRPPEPDPAWIPQLTAAFVREYPSVEIARKQYFLDLFASVVKSPEVEPLLESVLDAWKPGDYYEAPHSAIRELSTIDPARARGRILAELTKDKTWLDVQSLDLLPLSAVPPMDNALIDALARAQRSGGWNPQLAMAAIALYATPRVLPRIRAIYESQQQPCQPELVAYFVRVDPAYADRIFHSHAWDMHAAPPMCTLQYFERTPRLAMGPPLERYMAAYLMHGDVHVKDTAARSLMRYGSAAALPALWDAYRYFDDYWKGKSRELETSGENFGLESDLRAAIVRGRGWLVNDADVRLVESLCTSGRCIQETREDLVNMEPPLRIEVQDQGFALYARVAQYFGLESMAAVKGKLAQYPRGTHFTLRGSGRAAEEVRRYAVEVGMVVGVE